MERRRLDSWATVWWKFAVPMLWVVGLAEVFRQLSGQHTSPGIGLILFGIGSFLFAVRVAGVKRVSVGARQLYVSNYLQEVIVPLEAIERVSQFAMTNSPVTIHFNLDTDFGRSIRFMPGGRMVNAIGSHPVVAELREAAHCKLVAG